MFSYYVVGALKFAQAKHEGQVRKGSKLPYITHPVAVAMGLMTAFSVKENATDEDYSSRIITPRLRDDLTVAALLHDVMEDCGVTRYDLLSRGYSEFVVGLVEELTNDREEIKRVGKTKHHYDKFRALSSLAFDVKLFDRYDNINDQPTKLMVDQTLEILCDIEKDRQITALQGQFIDEIRRTCHQVVYTK